MIKIQSRDPLTKTTNWSSTSSSSLVSVAQSGLTVRRSLNQAEMELALRIFTGSNVAVSFNLEDNDPDEKYRLFYRMLERATSSNGEILRPTEHLIMPDSYIQTGKNAFSLYGESKIGPIKLGMLMTKTVSGPAESVKSFFPDDEYGFRLYNELADRPDEDNTWKPVVEALGISFPKGNVQRNLVSKDSKFCSLR